MPYVSQHKSLLNIAINYVKNPSNWPDGIPKLTNLIPGTVEYTMLAATSLLADMNGMEIYNAKQAGNISTASGVDLDVKANDYGITRKPAVAASANFIFTRNVPSPTATPISAGTLISTLPDTNGGAITFTTIEAATLPAGQTTVAVAAQCQSAGTKGNIFANTQLLVSSSVPGIDGVKITNDITNGIEKENDELLRIRTLNAFAGLARGTAEWYLQTASRVPGIQSATVVSQNRGPGTVDIFIVGPNNTIPSPDIQAAVQAAIDGGRTVTADAKEQVPTILAINCAIQIQILSGYEPSIIDEVQTAIKNYINNLGVGAGVLRYVYASQFIAIAMGVKGVANAKTTFIDTQITSYQLPQAGVITVTTF